jgi:adenine-specific DNA-methyltransferase
LARDLLNESGSVFLQIGDENLHHIREIIDEIFGVNNFCGVIAYRTTTGKAAAFLDSTFDFLLWYCKDLNKVKFHQSFISRAPQDDENLRWLELASGDRRRMKEQEIIFQN